MNEVIMDSILSNVLEIVTTIISLVVAYYVIPYIKNELIPWLKEKRLYSVVTNFVQAAEKMAESGMIAKVDKKAKVVELLENNGIVVNETVEAFIESSVKELDMVASVVYEEIIKAEEN
jgi:hypothetical protein